MTRLIIHGAIVWLMMPVLGIMTHAGGPDEASGPVLGTTIVLRSDGSIIRLAERDALSQPWSGTSKGIVVGSEHGCALAWPMAIEDRAIRQAIWLADGQCLPGALDPGAAPEPGMIQWRAGPLQFTLPLSSLRAWTAVGIKVPHAAIDADRITLRNGDTIDGLVMDVGRTVTIDVDGTTRSFDDERIASIQFVQAADPPLRRDRLRIWIDDGAVLDVESIERDGTLLVVKVPMPSGNTTFGIKLRIDQVLGVATPALACQGLPIRTQETPSGWSPLPGIIPSVELSGPGRLGAMQAILRGPGSWSMPIPKGGMLVSQVLVPDRTRALADHTLIVRQSGTELARFAARSDVRSMCVPVKPGTVEFELMPGKAGPVGCVMELADLVFIESTP